MGSATAQLPGLKQCSIFRGKGRVSVNDSMEEGAKTAKKRFG